MIKQIIGMFLQGIGMGFGETIPGVGAQTIAIITGIFDDVLNFLHEGTNFAHDLLLFLIKKKSVKELKASFLAIPWAIGLPVFVGLLLTIALLSGVVTYTVERYPQYVLAVAFGIILASITIPFREMDFRGIREYLIIIISAIVFFRLFTLNPPSSEASNPLFALFGGFVSAFAGFFPGVSISFALLLLGLYIPIYGGVHKITSGTATASDLLFIGLFALGLSVGIVVCVRAIPWLFSKFRSVLLSGMIGLMLASLTAVWPFLEYIPYTKLEELKRVYPWEVSLSEFTLILVFLFGTAFGILVIRRIMEVRGYSPKSFSFAPAAEKSKYPVKFE